MPARAYITSNYSRIIARVMGLQERDLPRLLAGTNLPRAIFDPGDETRLSGEQQLRLIQNARRMGGRDDLGLRIGQQLHPSVHGPIGYLALSSPDLITALKALRDYLPLRIGFARLKLEFSEEWMLCKLGVDLDGEPAEMRFLAECFALLLQALVEYVLGTQLTEAQFDFDFNAPAYASSYSQYIRAPVSFGQESCSVRLPANLALLENTHGDPNSYSQAMSLCQRMLGQIPIKAESISDRVRRLMLSQPAGTLTEEGVARALFISKRTLARRLDCEDTTYRQIRESLYSELAANHLRDPSLTIGAIALLLGYHDSATFRRAFRRWYGVPPAEFRRSNEN